MIDVEQKQREHRLVALRAVDFARESLEQRASIEQARERIGRRQRLEPPIVGARRLERLRALDRRNRRVQHRFGKLDVVIASDFARTARSGARARPIATGRC